MTMQGKQSFDPIDRQGISSKGKPPTHSNAVQGVMNASGGKHSVGTSNGIRSNSLGGAAGTAAQVGNLNGSNYPGMAESLRAQIATPRNNSLGTEEA